MTVPERETLRALAQQITPQDWECSGVMDAYEGDGPIENFIAACSPDVVLALLDRLDRYEEALREIADFLDTAAPMHVQDCPRGFRCGCGHKARTILFELAIAACSRALSVSEENP